jgi:DNA-binding NarL/FixJ family response regulator
MQLTSVAIVEDDERFLAAFEGVVRRAPDMRLVGTAVDLPGGFQLLNTHRPDVLVVDLGLPGGSGIELIRHVAAQLPGSDVMVVTVFGDEHHVLSSIAAGATGYLLKDNSDSDLADQIRTLRAGGSPISPVIARQLLLHLAPSAGPSVPVVPGVGPLPLPSRGQELSVQECKVLSYSAKGYSYDEIAQLLGVSTNTVMTYVKRCYRKLQVHSKTEAVYEAQRLGLLPNA